MTEPMLPDSFLFKGVTEATCRYQGSETVKHELRYILIEKLLRYPAYDHGYDE